MNPTTLKTKRLILRPPGPADAPALQSYLIDRRVAETTARIPHPYPEGGALEWIARVESEWATGVAVAFVICLRNTGELVGCISLFRGEDPGLEAGYWIGVPHWKRGYATEALHRLLRYAFNQLACPRVGAKHFAHNPASGRVMEKAGLPFERIIPGGSSREGVIYDSVRHGITAAEWRAALLGKFETASIP